MKQVARRVGFVSFLAECVEETWRRQRKMVSDVSRCIEARGAVVEVEGSGGDVVVVVRTDRSRGSVGICQQS